MYVKLRVVAGAKKESFVQKSKDLFLISVREKAEMNQANKRLLVLIADHFKVACGKVRIVSGHHSPGKILSVEMEG